MILYLPKPTLDKYNLSPEDLIDPAMCALAHSVINEQTNDPLLEWGGNKAYPSCVKTWEDNWDILSTFFAYPTNVRKIIYTMNIIDGLNHQFCQVTKNKPVSPIREFTKNVLFSAEKHHPAVDAKMSKMGCYFEPFKCNVCRPYGINFPLKNHVRNPNPAFSPQRECRIRLSD